MTLAPKLATISSRVNYSFGLSSINKVISLTNLENKLMVTKGVRWGEEQIRNLGDIPPLYIK